MPPLSNSDDNDSLLDLVLADLRVGAGLPFLAVCEEAIEVPLA